MATNAYAEFEDTFAEKHYFKALAGYNYEQQDYKSTYSERNGLLMPDAGNINFALGDVMSITGGGSRWRYVGAFFRFNYAYDDRYLLEVNGRYDGSSKFPNNSQWGFLPFGFGRLARFAGKVLECQPYGCFEPQSARFVRCAGQQ